MSTTLKGIGTFMVFMIMALSFSACSNNDEPAAENPNGNGDSGRVELKARFDIELTDAEKQLTGQSADFSIRLLQSANKTFSDNSQVVLSPLSASMALSMLNNGAAGDTQRELMEVLGFEGFTAEDINAFNKKLMLALNDLDNTSAVSAANSAWLNKGFKPKKSFTKALTENYDAEVESHDFSKAKTIDLINGWCEEKTNGCIKDILKGLSSDERLLLINALYFKGIWFSKFGVFEKGTFTTIQGQPQEADFMLKKERKFLYAESETFELAELPYGNEAFGFVVLLPKEGVDIDECIEGLTGEEWLKAVDGMKVELLNLKLPKFKVERTDELSGVLEGMGMTKAFTAAADFSSLSDEELFVSGILQGNSISVDENGTEAAAVTIIKGAMDAPPEMEPVPIDFHVDRPFLYFIKEKSTNTILFMGKIGQI